MPDCQKPRVCERHGFERPTAGKCLMTLKRGREVEKAERWPETLISFLMVKGNCNAGKVEAN